MEAAGKAVVDSDRAQLITFLEKKQQYENDGYKIFWIFESVYFEQLQERYSKKMIDLEKKLKTDPPKKLGNFLMCGHCKKNFRNEVVDGVRIIHLASSQGFSRGDVTFVIKVSSDETKKQIRQRFLQEFKRIIGHKEMVPDRSVVIISSEQERLLKFLKGNENKLDPKMKKRAEASKVRGQKYVTDYFQSTKPSYVSKPYKKKTEVVMNNSYEEISKLLRGEFVKILTVPKLHYELDPSNYVSVFLLNEISLRIAKDSGLDLKTHCEEALGRLPDMVWLKAVEHVETCEDFYLKDEQAEDDADSDTSNKEPEALTVQN